MEITQNNVVQIIIYFIVYLLCMYLIEGNSPGNSDTITHKLHNTINYTITLAGFLNADTGPSCMLPMSLETAVLHE